MPQASSLAAEIKDSLGIDAELIEEGGGIFDVKVDGELVFSKRELDRFPKPGEVVDAIQLRSSD